MAIFSKLYNLNSKLTSTLFGSLQRKLQKIDRVALLPLRLLTFLSADSVEAFSDYDYINRLNYGIWFTPVRTVTIITDIWMQEKPCNFHC